MLSFVCHAIQDFWRMSAGYVGLIGYYIEWDGKSASATGREEYRGTTILWCSCFPLVLFISASRDKLAGLAECLFVCGNICSLPFFSFSPFCIGIWMGWAGLLHRNNLAEGVHGIGTSQEQRALTP